MRTYSLVELHVCLKRLFDRTNRIYIVNRGSSILELCNVFFFFFFLFKTPDGLMKS